MSSGFEHLMSDSGKPCLCSWPLQVWTKLFGVPKTLAVGPKEGQIKS